VAGRGVAAGLAALLLVAACADDGRALAEPGPDQTTTTDPTGVGAGGTADSSGTTAAVNLSSPSVGDGQEIPAEFTCTGGNVTPALTWSNIPMGTAELAIVLRNVDDGGFLHWIVANLPAQSGGVAEGTVPAEAVQALNETGTTGYAGPCPEGSTEHYEFTLYALAQPIGLAPDTPARQALEQIESASQVASAVLSVTASP
jgi:hypothetical protein